MYRVAFPDGLVSVAEFREEDALRQLDGFVQTALGLHLLDPATFELRRYADAESEQYEVVTSATAEPLGAV